jgi:hypothetical protein
MKDKSINELNYVELRNGNIICLEDITDVYINSGYSFRDYYVCVDERTYNISSEEYDKIKRLLKDKANSYTIL